MEPSFEEICDETSECARVHLNNSNRKKLKDDEKLFDTTHSLHREENSLTERCVVCYSRGKRSESVWQCKHCGVAHHIEECF
jgi:rubrerythrin